MMVNIGLGIIGYEWFLSIPEVAAAAAVTLINYVTIHMIIKFGEDSIQKAIQSILLLSFIIVDGLFFVRIIDSNLEIILLSLYGGMLLMITWSAGHGARILGGNLNASARIGFTFINSFYRSRFRSSNINASTGQRFKRQNNIIMEEDR